MLAAPSYRDAAARAAREVSAMTAVTDIVPALESAVLRHSERK